VKKNLRVVAIVLARLGSKRFPGKVLAHLHGKALLMHVVDAARKAESVDEVVVATSSKGGDDRLAIVAQDAGVSVFRGCESDVLARFVYATHEYQADIAVRLTVDNPLVTAQIIDQVVYRHIETGADYTCNFLPSALPDGLEVEVLSRGSIDILAERAKTAEEREHVTRFIRTHQTEFHMQNVVHVGVDHKESISLSVDTPEDLLRVDEVYHSWKRVLAHVR